MRRAVVASAPCIALVLSAALAGFDVVSYTLRIGSSEAPVGDTASVDLVVHDIDGVIGTWTVEVSYDPEILSVIDCLASQNGVCEVGAGGGTIRITGASTAGLREDASIATIRFRCDEPGNSILSLNAISGSIPEIDFQVHTEDGGINCLEAPSPTPTSVAKNAPAATLPSTGGGPNANRPLLTAMIAWTLLVGGAAATAFAGRRVWCRWPKARHVDPAG